MLRLLATTHKGSATSERCEILHFLDPIVCMWQKRLNELCPDLLPDKLMELYLAAKGHGTWNRAGHGRHARFLHSLPAPVCAAPPLESTADGSRTSPDHEGVWFARTQTMKAWGWHERPKP